MNSNTGPTRTDSVPAEGGGNLAAALAEYAGELEPYTEEIAPLLIGIGQDLHEHPEIRYTEVHAAAVLTSALTEAGFAVTSGFADLPTAFVARWSSASADEASPTIAIFCEYDALEGIGHACGHNIIAASGLGAGLLTRRWLLDHSGVGAHLVVIGSPGEEGAAGKVPMIDGGVLDGIDLASMIHPSSVDLIHPEMLSRVALDVEFTGRASHAAGSPEEGVNALDAATLTLTAIGLLRQQLTSDVRIHGIVTDGGQAPNIIPETSALRFFVRADDRDRLLDVVVPKVKNCAKGAALATGCQVLIEERTPPYFSMITNQALAEVATAAFGTVGRALDAPIGVQGSTDMGNVSHRVPALHPMIKLGDELAGHTRQFAAAAAGEAMGPTILDGATILALTAIRAASDPELVALAKAEFGARFGD